MPIDGDEELEGDEEGSPPTPRWAEGAQPQGSVFVETGRGQAVEVQAGTPFQEAIERLAAQAN